MMIDWATYAYDMHFDEMPLDVWVDEYAEESREDIGEDGAIDASNYIVSQIIEYVLGDTAWQLVQILLDTANMSVTLSGYESGKGYRMEIDIITYEMEKIVEKDEIQCIPLHMKSIVYADNGVLFKGDKLSEDGIKQFAREFIRNLRFV